MFKIHPLSDNYSSFSATNLVQFTTVKFSYFYSNHSTQAEIIFQRMNHFMSCLWSQPFRGLLIYLEDLNTLSWPISPYTVFSNCYSDLTFLFFLLCSLNSGFTPHWFSRCSFNKWSRFFSILFHGHCFCYTLCLKSFFIRYLHGSLSFFEPSLYCNDHLLKEVLTEHPI